MATERRSGDGQKLRGRSNGNIISPARLPASAAVTSDLGDIRIMLETCSDQRRPVVRELLQDYLDLFEQKQTERTQRSSIGTGLTTSCG